MTDGGQANSRVSWRTTTHDWSRTVDLAHLADIRRRADVLAPDGVLHLVLEVLAYADEEAEALGRTGRVEIVLGQGSVSVADDGRGTETRVDQTGAVVRKPIMSTKDVRFFDTEDGPLLPNGHRRYGISVVAALSSVLTHENRRIEGGWTQTYRFGVPDSDLTPVSDAGPTGTTVTFWPRRWSAINARAVEQAAAGFRHLLVTVRS